MLLGYTNFTEYATRQYQFDISAQLSLSTGIAEEEALHTAENIGGTPNKLSPTLLYSTAETLSTTTNLRKVTVEVGHAGRYRGSQSPFRKEYNVYRIITLQLFYSGGWNDSTAGVYTYDPPVPKDWGTHWVNITSEVVAADITQVRLKVECFQDSHVDVSEGSPDVLNMSVDMNTITKYYSAGIISADGTVNWIAVGQ